MMRFGIIGRNFIVDMMLEAMAAVPEIEPAAIYSRDPDAAAAFADKHGLNHAYSNLEDLAACPDIDAVYIASPNSCHYPQAKLMLEAGKHVLCEKPASSNVSQVRELVRMAEKKGLVFLEGMRPVYSEALRVLHDNLPRIGRLRQVSINYCKPSSRYALFLEKGDAVNTFNPALSNAAVMDLGCYGIHSLVSLFGRPVSVSAQSVHLKNGFEALGTVLMTYPAFIASVTYSKVSSLDLPCAFGGEDGTLYMDQLNHTQRIWMQLKGDPEVEMRYEPPVPNDMTFELRAFHRFATDGVRPFRENWNSIVTAEILDEVRRQTNTLFPADRE